MEWAAHQVESTLDWNMTSRFWLYASNGLNNQGIHHLFPQVDWAHYPDLVPILKRTCEEFGVKHHCAPTLWSALTSHLAHIAEVNEESSPTARQATSPRQGSSIIEPRTVGGLAFLGQIDEYHS